MKESTIVFNSIVKDWTRCFPEFGRYGSKQLLRILGPVAIGVELLKISPTTYRPEAILLNLVDDPRVKPLPMVYQFLKGKNQVQIQVPFEKHNSLIGRVSGIMREQASIIVEPLPSLSDIMNWIIRFLNEDYVKGTNTFHQYRTVMMLSKLLKDDKLGMEYFSKAMKNIQEMPKWILETGTGGFESWLEHMKCIEPEQLIDNLKVNTEHWKMTNLPLCKSHPGML